MDLPEIVNPQTQLFSFPKSLKPHPAQNRLNLVPQNYFILYHPSIQEYGSMDYLSKKQQFYSA